MDKLIIIFTLFDHATFEYLQYFDRRPPTQKAKAISYGLYYQSLNEISNFKQVDIVLISEDHYADSSDKSLLKKIIAQHNEVYLTLHKGGRDNYYLEHEIQKITSSKLQLPIRNEIHTKGGEAYNMLLKIGKNHQNGNAHVYQAILNTYLKDSGFELSLEAKFEILHLANDTPTLEELLMLVEPKTSIDHKIIEIIHQPAVEKVVKTILANPAMSYYSRLNLLQEVLFVKKEEKPIEINLS